MTNKKELNDKLLEEISGGVLTENVTDNVKSIVDLCISKGYDKSTAIEGIKEDWAFFQVLFSTDGSKEDLDTTIKLISDEFDARNK